MVNVKPGQFVDGKKENLLKVYSVEVYEGGGEAWREGGVVAFIKYNTEDIVYFDEDGVVEIVTTHDNMVIFRNGGL